MYKVLCIKYRKFFELKSFFVFFGILYTAYLILNTVSANAQETLRTFTVVPPSVSKTLNPGEYTEGTMKVINDSNESLTFYVSTRDYVVLDTKGTPIILPPNTLSKKFSGASWIGVSPSNFTVNPHEKQILNYYLQIPADAKPGGHYAAVVFKPGNLTSSSGTGAVVETQIGSLFYISVNGDITEKSSISQFFANAFQEFGPVKVKTRIENFGDLHIKPQGTVKVTDMLGRTIETQKLSEFNIFPLAARDYENSFGQKLMIGRFQASLLASYGKNENLPLIATAYFWVFPWKIATLVILAAAAIILGVMYWRKRKSLTQKHTEQNTDQTE